MADAQIADRPERPAPMSEEMRDAVLAEVLGDVRSLHQCAKDLLAITTETDERITARVVELRALASDLAHARETLLAEIALQASDQAQRRLETGLGKRIEDLKGAFDARGPSSQPSEARRYVDLVAVAIVSGFITGLITLGGAWLIVHAHIS
jgi:hypothetical protein